MITYLKGILASKGEMLNGGAFLVLEVGGVGFQILTSSVTLLQSPAVGDPLTVYTSLIVREDLMQLIGFLSREERDLFDLLVSASGVGPKVALALLSELSVSEIASAIMVSDHKRLSSAKGVGPKLAQKIALELKDKMSKWRDEKLDQYAGGQTTMPMNSTSIQEAQAVLLSLGYNLSEISDGLRALQSTNPAVESLSSEEILKEVLRWLAVHPVQ